MKRFIPILATIVLVAVLSLNSATLVAANWQGDAIEVHWLHHVSAQGDGGGHDDGPDDGGGPDDGQDGPDGGHDGSGYATGPSHA